MREFRVTRCDQHNQHRGSNMTQGSWIVERSYTGRFTKATFWNPVSNHHSEEAAIAAMKRAQRKEAKKAKA